jgi:hypothetical protein
MKKLKRRLVIGVAVAVAVGVSGLLDYVLLNVLGITPEMVTVSAILGAGMIGTGMLVS